jgi:hypothetical protein
MSFPELRPREASQAAPTIKRITAVNMANWFFGVKQCTNIRTYTLGATHPIYICLANMFGLINGRKGISFNNGRRMPARMNGRRRMAANQGTAGRIG